MKKTINIITVLFIAIIGFSFLTNSCTPITVIQSKSGAQLWGENCQRCHNMPPPNIYSDSQWEIVGVHMKLRANLTQTEVDKVTKFLQSAN